MVEIPFEDIKLPGYYFKAGEGERPTLIVMSGFDGTAEELYFYIGAGALQRGYNVLLFEGPGQVGPIHLYPDKPFRPDYHGVIKAVVDFIITRKEVDEDKLVLVGYSLGGYFVSEAVIHEKRIRACVADSPIVDIVEYYQGMGTEMLDIDEKDYPYVFKKYPMARWAIESINPRYGVKNFQELTEKITQFNIEDELEKITCATLALVGEGEGDDTIAQARKFFDGVGGDKTMHIFTVQEGADSHCQVSNMALMNGFIFGWLDEVLS